MIFLSISASSEEASEFSRVFDKTYDELGINVNHVKDVTGPILEFLCIELDTMLMEARLPNNKLQDAKDPRQARNFKKTLFIPR